MSYDRDIYVPRDCPVCGKEQGARTNSTSWLHDELCCSDVCGFRMRDCLREMEDTAEYEAAKTALLDAEHRLALLRADAIGSFEGDYAHVDLRGNWSYRWLRQAVLTLICIFVIWILSPLKAAAFPLTSEHAQSGYAELFPSSINVGYSTKEIEGAARRGFGTINDDVSGIREAAVEPFFERAIVPNFGRDIFIELPQFSGSKGGTLRQSQIAPSRVLELPLVGYETYFDKTSNDFCLTATDIGQFKRQFIPVVWAGEKNVSQYQSRAMFGKILKPGDFFLFSEDVGLSFAQGDLLLRDLYRPLRQLSLLNGGAPQGASEPRHYQGSNGSHKAIVAIYNFDDPKQREWADMVVGALGFVCLFAVFAKIASELDKQRAEKQKHQQRRNHRERN